MISHIAGVDESHPAVLVASELATNAIVHTSDGFTVSVRANNVVRVEVSDKSPDPPQLAASPVPARAGGLGLQIVDQFSDRWGSIVNQDGKTVWAEVTI